MRQEWKKRSKRGLSTAPYILLSILILAALLRLLQLGSESLWFDEAITVATVHLDWEAFWKVLSHKEANMGLYYCLLRLWVNLGESEFVLRSLSALAGVLTVGLVYVLGKRLSDTKVGLMGAALLATNSFHIQYSQEARGYSLMVLLTALSSLFFLRAIEHSSRNEWAGYILTATLAVYTHFFSVLVLEAHWVWLILVRRRNIPWRGFLVAVLAIGMLLVPLAIFALTRGKGEMSWIPRTRPHDAYRLFNSLVGGGRLLLLAYFVPCSIALQFGPAAEGGCCASTFAATKTPTVRIKPKRVAMRCITSSPDNCLFAKTTTCNFAWTSWQDFVHPYPHNKKRESKVLSERL